MALRIIVAPQEYKGTLTAEEAAGAIAHGVRRAAPDALIEEIPLADGGPGTVRAVLAGTPGRFLSSVVTGPMGDPVTAEWALLDDGTAVIEMAAAAGLLLVPEKARDPDRATTRGVGELLLAALDAGCRQIILGLGGSATNDGGAGMAQALGARLTDADGHDLPTGGAALIRLHHIDASGLDPRLRNLQITAATDVRNPLCGPDGASIVYGPQKGASPDLARSLDAALAHYARIIERDLGVSVAGIRGAGSAGGLGAGLVAFLGATIEPGIDIVARVLRLRERLAGADLLITGEGRLDGQTGWGKAVAGALGVAWEAGVAAVIVPGSLGPGWDEFHTLAAVIEPAADPGKDPVKALAAAAKRAFRRWLDSR
jgi:glycerate kinase